jgi:rSAM/selenodomain-associated transferase 2
MIDELAQPVLVVFCRRPKLGYGKQRLAQSIGQPPALKVAQLLLNCATADACDWPGRVVIAVADVADVSWARGLVPAAEVLAQPKGGLGHRIAQIDTRVRATGAERVIFIGSDAPGLRDIDLLAAATALKDRTAVFIPAADGGVTLLGATKSWPQLDDLAWETPGLFLELLSRCESVGWHCAQLESGYDIDTLPDLLRAGRDLATDKRPSRQDLCRWIREARLDNLPAPFPSGADDTVSVVIPVYRDQQALEQLLVQLRTAGAPPDEIIVVDGSQDAAAQAAHESACQQFVARYYRTVTCRGAQMQFGATLARGSILWFLHADAGPSADATGLIRKHIKRGCAGGYFRFRFAGPTTRFKRALAWLINLRAAAGTPYGDQGLFMQTAAYFAAGGFAAEPLFEEVSLTRNLRKTGKFKPLPEPIDVATRRWDRDGWLRRTLRNRILAIRYMLGVSPTALAVRYRKEPEAHTAD